jgi:glycosyltransferase involved in cell wall biosynthesis
VYKEKPDFQLHIFGHGSSKSAVRKLAEDRIWLKVHEFLEEQDFVRHLSESSIGVVPHPDYPVWRICSALKLREYAAMGMAVVARRLPVHEEFEGEDWMFIKEDGVGETSLAAGMISALQGIEKNGNSISSSSREYAEKYFTYGYQTKALLNWIGI